MRLKTMALALALVGTALAEQPSGHLVGRVWRGVPSGSYWKPVGLLPAPGRKVLIEPTQPLEADNKSWPLFATTDASGAFQFNALPPGNYTLSVEQRRQQLQVRDGESDATLVVDAPAGATPGYGDRWSPVAMVVPLNSPVGLSHAELLSGPSTDEQKSLSSFRLCALVTNVSNRPIRTVRLQVRLDSQFVGVASPLIWRGNLLPRQTAEVKTDLSFPDPIPDSSHIELMSVRYADGEDWIPPAPVRAEACR